MRQPSLFAKADPWVEARAWIADNPEPWGWVVATARRLASEGRRTSIKALMERVRWEWHIERGDRAYKCNNSHFSILARILIASHPEVAPYIETRTGAYVERVAS